MVRNKCHVRLRVTQSRPVVKATGLRCDQAVVLTTRHSRRACWQPLRWVHFRDTERKRSLIFLTNNFQLEPEVICDLYRRRWQVELFFKWIKQHLRIRNFYGRSENAIRCQVWAAICSYLLVAIAKKEHRLKQSLYQMLQVVSLILVRVQGETNYPRPSADARHAITIRSQPWQARFQGSHHPSHV